MKKLTLFFSIFAVAIIFSSAVMAEGQNIEPKWSDTFQAMLEKGKQAAVPAGQPKPTGLAYTAPDEIALEEAISFALKQDKSARVCECLKIAIDLDYNPYLVIKTIYTIGANLDIDQLCMCATEAGVMKAIIAKAAKDAVTPLDKPVYNMDEIAQSQCLRGVNGLAYTRADNELKEIPTDGKEDKNYVSTSKF